MHGWFQPRNLSLNFEARKTNWKSEKTFKNECLFCKPQTFLLSNKETADLVRPRIKHCKVCSKLCWFYWKHHHFVPNLLWFSIMPWESFAQRNKGWGWNNQTLCQINGLEKTERLMKKKYLEWGEIFQNRITTNWISIHVQLND